jgi:hypothetical protein
MKGTPEANGGQTLTLSYQELFVIWAALLAMVQDNHSAQDGMSGDQWDDAETLYEQLTRMVEPAH